MQIRLEMFVIRKITPITYLTRVKYEQCDHIRVSFVKYV